MKTQCTFTVSEGKRLIAKAIASLPEVRHALQKGTILLKGGTTVSAIAEELCGMFLRISGRITPRGTVGAATNNPEEAHCMILHRGVPEAADENLLNIARDMGPEDVAICGVNLIDMGGNAAMMAGRDLGGVPGSVIPALHAEGVFCIVPAGLEKLSPVNVHEAAAHAGRKASVWSTGMAVGLIPIPGRIITEIEALSILGFEKHWLIGRGGIDGAEGSSTFVIEHDSAKAKELHEMIRDFKGATSSGVRESLLECTHCGPGRAWHLGCIYGKMNRSE